MDDDKIKTGWEWAAEMARDRAWPDDARTTVLELLKELRQVEEEAHEAVRVLQERVIAAETERDQARTSRDRAKSMCADLDREVESLRKRLRIGGR